jgi:hypothetical protein
VWIPSMHDTPGHFTQWPLIYQQDELFRDADYSKINGDDAKNLISGEYSKVHWLIPRDAAVRG